MKDSETWFWLGAINACAFGANLSAFFEAYNGWHLFSMAFSLWMTYWCFTKQVHYVAMEASLFVQHLIEKGMLQRGNSK